MYEKSFYQQQKQETQTTTTTSYDHNHIPHNELQIVSVPGTGTYNISMRLVNTKCSIPYLIMSIENYFFTRLLRIVDHSLYYGI
jgi:hypothetical protein